jgi:hypothetical protein
MRKPLILPRTEVWPSENCVILEPWNYISLKSLPVSTTSRRNARRSYIQKSVDAIVAKATRVHGQILAHSGEAGTRTSTSTFRSPAETKHLYTPHSTDFIIFNSVLALKSLQYARLSRAPRILSVRELREGAVRGSQTPRFASRLIFHLTSLLTRTTNNKIDNSDTTSTHS